MTTLIAPKDGAVVPLQTQNQKAFVEHVQRGAWPRGNIKNLDWMHLERQEKEDYTTPLKVEFRFRSDENPVRLSWADNPYFENAETVMAEDTVTVGNLKANTKYYWKVNDSEVWCFLTEEAAPRWIEAGGLTNIRDIGGWSTARGWRVRQGCIYRGSEMDTHHTMTESGLHTLRDTLKIKTDLDVRSEAAGRLRQSPLGEGVRLVLLPLPAYSALLEGTPEIKNNLRCLFETMADSDNYPIYFHCWGGADRTGTVVFLLNALLGVPCEDLMLDYELTSLSVWGIRSREGALFSAFMEALNGYEGASVNQKAESFLRSCGIRGETLASLRYNLWEKGAGRCDGL